MAFLRSLLIPICIAAGLVCGIAAKRIVSPPPPRRTADSTPEKTHASSVQAESDREIRSQDTVETLLALPERQLYARLALWLLDADETGISTFLERYRQHGGKDHEILPLLYANWTRLNPHGAIHAATEEDRFLVWTAWASHDLQAALVVGNMSPAIGYAIGAYHPNWMLAHFDQIPTRGRESAISALRFRDPTYPVTLRTVRLAEKWQSPELNSALRTLLADSDPFQGWFLLNPDNQYDYSSLEMFMYHLKPSQYGELERISDSLPPGELKRQLDFKAMQLLARVDPDAALSKARANEVPRIKAQLMAIAGKAFIYSDPKKALQIADELFAASPGLFALPKIDLPNGKGDWIQQEHLSEVHDFLSGVSHQDPQALMETFLARDPDLLATKTLESLSYTWARQTPEPFAKWLNAQTDPRIREPGTRSLVAHLAEQEQYPEALDWAVSLPGPTDNSTNAVFQKWRKFDQTAALEWLDAANIPDDRKAKLREGGKR